MSTMTEQYEDSMAELHAFIRGRESGAKDALTKSLAVNEEGKREIALLHRGLDELKKANLGGQLTDTSYANLRRMALARLEQLGASDQEATTLTKSIVASVRHGSVAPLAGMQSLITLGNLQGRCSPEYIHDLANIGR